MQSMGVRKFTGNWLLNAAWPRWTTQYNTIYGYTRSCMDGAHMAIGMVESFITGHWFSAPAKAIWSDSATLQAWLDVEAALAHAQAGLGVIPAEVAPVTRHSSIGRAGVGAPGHAHGRPHAWPARVTDDPGLQARGLGR